MPNEASVAGRRPWGDASASTSHGSSRRFAAAFRGAVRIWHRPSVHRRRRRARCAGPSRGRIDRDRAKPASRMRALASSLPTSSYRPARRWRGRVTGPKRTRMSRLTVHPTASKSRRTSRFRPSPMTTWNHRFAPSPPTGRNASNRASPSSSTTPPVSDSSARALGTPRTRTAYSRSIPEPGCMSRWASSPSSVNRSRPVVLKSNRPTATHRARPTAGRRSNTVGLPSGSLRAVSSPAGLW